MTRRPFLLLTGALGGALIVRARHERQATERLAAAALESLLNAIDANDHDTGEHLRRTAAYAIVLARAAGAGDEERHRVERVALFHDIGKLHEALFDVVHDAERLSPEERELVATHPRRGADVLRPLAPFYPELPEGVLSHHEWWDGTGYPRQLKGDAIPFEARVVAIADSFDAMLHGRRYQEGRGVADVLHAIASGRGTQFDPELVDRFLSPPVQRDIQRAMGAPPPRPRLRSPERRASRGETDVPDVTFRWRPGSHGRPESDPAR